MDNKIKGVRRIGYIFETKNCRVLFSRNMSKKDV